MHFLHIDHFKGKAKPTSYLLIWKIQSAMSGPIKNLCILDNAVKLTRHFSQVIQSVEKMVFCNAMDKHNTNPNSTNNHTDQNYSVYGHFLALTQKAFYSILFCT